MPGKCRQLCGQQRPGGTAADDEDVDGVGKRRPISEDEIVKRCAYGMVNEGAKLLEQGIALRPSDIDIVYVTGYGFPAQHGGPMYYADRIGLAEVLADVKRFHAEYGFWWKPAPLLERLAREGPCRMHNSMTADCFIAGVSSRDRPTTRAVRVSGCSSWTHVGSNVRDG